MPIASLKKIAMEERREKYINGPATRPFTDYGFKHPFGEEPNKDLLLGFLNELLKHAQGRITELTYLKFKRLFEVAEIARFSPEEAQAHEDSLRSYRDLKNSLDTAS